MVHEQVQMQLAHLKSLVDAEAERQSWCKEWGVRYIPARTKLDNIEQYKNYMREIERHGDQNLLVWVRLKGEGGLNLRGVYPFAKRYVEPNRQGEYYLTHRTHHGSEILFRDSQVEVIEKTPFLELTLQDAMYRSEQTRRMVKAKDDYGLF